MLPLHSHGVDNASTRLNPVQTLILKHSSGFEVRRSGAARKYKAVMLRSAGPVGVASAAKNRAEGIR